MGDTPHWSDPPQTLHRSPLQHEQLAMFMTPREITSKYQVLDADRQEHGGEGSWDEGSTRNYQRTDRSARTGGETNVHDPGKIHYGYGTSGDYIRQPIDETDAQLLGRKLYESQMDPDEYKEHHQGIGASASSSWDPEAVMGRSSAPRMPSNGGSSAEDSYYMHEDSYLTRKMEQHYERKASRESIHESVAREGVRSPVHLSTNQFGTQGKPSIVGGHHRIAAALDIAPDKLIPVQHSRDIWHAKSSENYS